MPEDLGIKPSDLPKTPKQRDKISIALDCAFARLYGLNYQELAHITSKEYFKLFNEQNEAYILTLLEAYRPN